MSIKSSFSFILCLSVLSLQNCSAQSNVLSKGTSTPIFTAKASLNGKDFNFSMKKALAKGAVVVYFYPAAYTGGCDLEAHTFAEMKSSFTKAGATIIGISADNIQRLNSFSADPNFCAGQFPIASDPEGKIAAAYGLHMMPPQSGVKDVRGETVTHGFFPRTTFVINSKGKIVAVFSSDLDHISPVQHVEKSLGIVEKLR